MLPLAPPTFSTTTDWTSNVCIPAATTRPSTSVSPPGGKGTIIVMGRDGYVCALTIRETAGSAAAPAARCRSFLRGNLMVMLQQLEHLPDTFNYIQHAPQCLLWALSRHGKCANRCLFPTLLLTQSGHEQLKIAAVHVKACSG